MIASAAILLVFSCLSVIVLRGYAAPEGALELAFPLRDATYYVGGGGNSRFINNHQAHEPQKFALDIVRLNAFGNRAAVLAPTRSSNSRSLGTPSTAPARARSFERWMGCRISARLKRTPKTWQETTSCLPARALR